MTQAGVWWWSFSAAWWPCPPAYLADPGAPQGNGQAPPGKGPSRANGEPGYCQVAQHLRSTEHNAHLTNFGTERAPQGIFQRKMTEERSEESEHRSKASAKRWHSASLPICGKPQPGKLSAPRRNDK